MKMLQPSGPGEREGEEQRGVSQREREGERQNRKERSTISVEHNPVQALGYEVSRQERERWAASERTAEEREHEGERVTERREGGKEGKKEG